jgi:hypothetical protein
MLTASIETPAWAMSAADTAGAHHPYGWASGSPTCRDPHRASLLVQRQRRRVMTGLSEGIPYATDPVQSGDRTVFREHNEGRRGPSLGLLKLAGCQVRVGEPYCDRRLAPVTRGRKQPECLLK